MSLEQELRANTEALTRLADLIEANSDSLRAMQENPINLVPRYPATLEGDKVIESVDTRQGDRRKDAVTPAKIEAAVEKAVEHALEQAAPAIAEAVAEKVDGKPEEHKPTIMIGADPSLTIAPGEEIPEFTWEGVTKQFRKYAQAHGRDEAVKLAKEFGLSIPLNKDELKPEKFEEFYYACSN